MKQYMLSVYHGDEIPASVDIDKMMRDVDALNGELQAAGAWVFACGLHPATTSTVVRPGDGDELVTDGPYLETKEHIGGFWVIKSADLDAALAWGRQAARATTQPVEVRPLQEEAGD